MRDKAGTDWDSYYRKPKSKVSSVTQKITLKYLINVLQKCNMERPWRVMECGGGNSCFATDFCERFKIEYYDIIDKCKLGVQKAENKNVIRKAVCIDLLEELTDKNYLEKYDLVYSVGLVEHFSDEERERVIQNHFKLCNKGGYVLITAPTPTKKYLFIRKVMELLHVWQFWDETPLELSVIKNEVKQYGTIISLAINKKLPLTQLVVLIRKEI